MNLKQHICNWARLVNENCNSLGQVHEDENGLFDYVSELFEGNDEVVVTQEGDAVYVSFDASGYDNESYARNGFEEVKKTILDEIAQGNKYDGASVSVEEDPDNEYTLRVVSNGELNEVSIGRPGDEDPSMSARPSLSKYRSEVKSGQMYGVSDIGQEMMLFIQALKDTNNWQDVLDGMDTGEVATIFGTILDNVDERQFQEAYGTLLEEGCQKNESLFDKIDRQFDKDRAVEQDEKNGLKTDTANLDDISHAKKLGFSGDDKKAKEWLGSEYGKWRDQTYRAFVEMTGGDEDQSLDMLKTYFHLIYNWMYSGADAKKKDLYAKMGDSPVARELKDRLDKYISKEKDAISEFYATSSSRGGWTGD